MSQRMQLTRSLHSASPLPPCKISCSQFTTVGRSDLRVEKEGGRAEGRNLQLLFLCRSSFLTAELSNPRSTASVSLCFLGTIRPFLPIRILTFCIQPLFLSPILVLASSVFVGAGLRTRS
ncbi:hypothetical protein ILYODFUR_026315 [Ilyodon furcidens]|uniref:Uncharacterized protein n=1 Tax=Ilyodon furcidens TaxID=33524 RepID=A0ABV0VI91_9TELE